MRSDSIGLLLVSGLALRCGEIGGPPFGGNAPAPSWLLITDEADAEDDDAAMRSLARHELSLFADSSGVPHVAFTRFRSLEHAWVTGDRFEYEVIDGQRPGWSVAWAVEHDDPILVFGGYQYISGVFQARRNATGAWESGYQELSSDPPMEAAAPSAARRDGELHVVQVAEAPLLPAETPAAPGFDGQLIRHVPMYGNQPAPFSGPGTIALEVVPHSTAMAVDRAGTIHFIYTAPADDYAAYLPGADSVAPFTVRYATVANGVWSAPETLTEVPGFYAGLSMVSDGHGTVHASFSQVFVRETPDADDRRTAMIKYFRRSAGSTWTREAVALEQPVLLSRGSLAVDPDDGVHIAYCRASNESARCNALGVAHRSKGEWTWEVVDDRCVDIGDLAAIAADSMGGVHVAYRGCGNSLAYAYRPPVTRP